ncbi:hypothetical protein A2291_01760 [candidate division WOR-1 bacterium RIFOXYB2_FULL_42_35]|uniref:V-type ATP synthase subunit C n=1 Tax=candidate division WOR-1 bacterium RIFOXYC2_FULL_41_25 TaxID=1802586 RepID=A0A1F4TQF9_UNCSA|nr:MAG: hypothetical protein A2247_03560 [candidate division WOR-1 bacterium RIFOXYA2_FULL_41_14]OGC25471.1 MAG: hypothetical protein A2291_01760 [candidate division WOR-1 bacterium RIFOXYB2_FULL_42_35]OGC34877.1 MAG: hypothetical protein A2462_05695 [candidate division WOR-1 bacterium RIFOXYC2_FULL_41_25]OGC42130.1 MAG: hypothetical protein A2548_01990 [candidate division WOR-1 bacterium RIFOXYD2_FULL_41_8]
MEKYYYGTGRTRALEAHLLSPEQLARMSAAGDFAAALAVLSETPYTENLAKLKKSFDFEELCELEQLSLADLLLKLSLGHEFIKALLKKPDRDYYDNLLKLSQTISSPLINRMVKQQLDLINIKTLLRSKELEQSKTEFKPLLLNPGFIDQDRLLKLYDQTLEEIVTKLSFTPYFPSLSDGFKYYKENRSFHLLEKLMANFILQQFKTAKYLGSGLEPLVGFYLAKEAEIKTVRFILICKKNQVPNERIKERLRVSY